MSLRLTFGLFLLLLALLLGLLLHSPYAQRNTKEAYTQHSEPGNAGQQRAPQNQLESDIQGLGLASESELDTAVLNRWDREAGTWTKAKQQKQLKELARIARFREEERRQAAERIRLAEERERYWREIDEERSTYSSQNRSEAEKEQSRREWKSFIRSMQALQEPARARQERRERARAERAGRYSY